MKRAHGAAALVLLLVAACGSDDGSPAGGIAPELPDRRVRVDERILRDRLDRQVIWRGYNVGGRAKLPPFYPFDLTSADPGPEEFGAQSDEFYGRVADLGTNIIRLTFNWEALEPTRGVYDATYVARYRRMLDSIALHDMAAIVEFHQDLFARPICGEGFPLWALPADIAAQAPDPCPGFPVWGLAYFDPTSAANQAFDLLWENEDGLRDAFVAAWRHVAIELLDHPAVAAVEILNEPPAGSIPFEEFEEHVLPEFFEIVGTAIREIDPDVTILVEGRAGDATGLASGVLGRPDLEGIAFAPHYYNPITAGLNLPRVNVAGVRNGLDNSLATAERWGVPGILGEFGVLNANPLKGYYLRTVYDRLDEIHAHGIQWDVTQTTTTLWNEEDFSALRGDGSEREWVPEADRPFPRAVSGALESFRWDAEDRVFHLAVAAAGPHPTEVRLPARHLGPAPMIELTGPARATFADPELLLVEAEEGARWELVAVPG